MTVSRQNTNRPKQGHGRITPLFPRTFLIERNPLHRWRNFFLSANTNLHPPICRNHAMKAQTFPDPGYTPCLFALKTNSQTICPVLAQPIPVRRNPNPARQRNPFPEHYRHPAPIHPPAVYPHPRHRCPCLKKENETSAFQKDNGKQPGIRRSVSHSVFIITTEEYAICGYESGGKKIGRLILGYEQENGMLCYRGRINLGDEKMDELVIRSYPRQRTCPFAEPGGLRGIKAVWLMPGLNCLIQCSQKSPGGIIQSGVYRTLILEQPSTRARITITPGKTNANP